MDESKDEPTCWYFAHSVREFCNRYGGRFGGGYSNCALDDKVVGDADFQIESFRPVSGHVFAKFNQGTEVKSIAVAEPDASALFMAVSDNGEDYFIERVLGESSFLNKTVWKRALPFTVKPLLLGADGILISANNSALWKRKVTCSNLYGPCFEAIKARNTGDPLGCGWCVDKQGNGEASDEISCTKHHFLKKSCLPEFSQGRFVSENDSSLLNIHGHNLDKYKIAKVTVCQKYPCHIVRKTNEFTPEPGKLHLKEAVFLAFAFIIAATLVGFCVFGFVWRAKRRQKPDDGSSSILPLPVNGAGYLHPTGRRNSYDVQPGQSIPMDLVPYEDLAFLVPENIRIPLNSLHLANVVGEGHFGIVYKAIYKTEEGTDVLVAVKTLHAGVRGVREFLQEGIIMEHFNHPRVMSLIGISFTEACYPMIITPFMPRGDLLTYLRDPSNWSYGVVLWELMTRGAIPYHGTPGYMLLSFLKDNNRLVQPDYCPPELYDVMCHCWRMNPGDRPTFSELCLTVPGVIQSLENSVNKRKSLENHYYVNCKPGQVDRVDVV